MSLRSVFLALVLLWPGAAADDLPPGILLLSRIKRHMREEIAHLPDYTCLQTARRFRHKGPGDTVVLQVLYAGGKELYASPGTRDFWHEDPGSFTSGGLSGTGLFAIALHEIFVDDNAMFTYRGDDDLNGRRAVQYDYRVPLLSSGFTIHLGYASGRVSTRGSFWADPDTLDLLKIEYYADDIPPNLPLASALQSVDYARTRIGERSVILPQSASIDMLETTGEESRNLLEFTHCQAFAAESTLSWNAPESVAAAPPARPAPQADALPAGLTITLELGAPVTVHDSVGSQIQARVAFDVKDKRRILVPAGASVRGRIRRLERGSDGGKYYVVGLEFTHIETALGTARFYANLQDLEKRSNIKLILSNVTGPRQSEQIWLPYLPGVASFFVTGEMFDLPAGFRMIWKTKSPR